MEGILGFLTIVIVFGVLFGGFQFFMGKYFGVKFHGRFQLGHAIREEELIQQQLHNQNKYDIEEGILRCKNKGYVITANNVLSEIKKIQKERIPKIPQKPISIGLKDKIASVLLTNESKTLNKLERLEKLKNSGTLDENEFNKLKKQILGHSHNRPSTKQLKKECSEEAEQRKKEYYKKESEKILTQLYYEFKNDFEELKNRNEEGLFELLFKVQLNETNKYIYENYNKIEQLYLDGIISKDEYHNKKRLILLNATIPIN